MGEKKILHLILPYNQNGISLIGQTDIHFKNGGSIVYQKNPWYLPESIDINSFNEIPFYDLDSTYGLAYYIDNKGLSISFNSKNIICDYFMEVKDSPRKVDYDILKKWSSSSKIIMAGFETTIFIGNPYQSIENIISDEGLYPVLIVRKGTQEEFRKEGKWNDERINLLRDLVRIFI